MRKIINEAARARAAPARDYHVVACHMAHSRLGWADRDLQNGLQSCFVRRWNETMFEKTLADLVRGIRAHKGQEVNLASFLGVLPPSFSLFMVNFNLLQRSVL